MNPFTQWVIAQTVTHQSDSNAQCCLTLLEPSIQEQWLLLDFKVRIWSFTHRTTLCISDFYIFPGFIIYIRVSL